MKLDGRVGHLEPSDVDANKEIIWKWGNLATVDDEIIDLVAAEALDRVPEYLWVLDVPAIGHHLGPWLQRVRVAGQVPGQSARPWPARQPQTGRLFVVREPRGGRVGAGYSNLWALVLSGSRAGLPGSVAVGR